MSNVVRWVVRLVSGAPAVKPSPLPLNVARVWLPQHRDNLLNFLASDTGIALLQRMSCVASESARTGAADVMHTSHSAGRATGFYDALQWLQSQAYIEFETISGADADQSATSTQEQQGEALLREHYAP